MRMEYQYNDGNLRGYVGLSVNEGECREHFQGRVKDILIDREERENMINDLKSLIEESGFNTNSQLLVDIQYLQSEKVSVQDFRIGEAYAEVILEENFSCRFHWNELRDTRNPRGNKTGADLVGFIEFEGEVLFLFGEVKTSSEDRRPPQVMTYEKGLENQLRDLYQNGDKRLILIAYLGNKARLYPTGHIFREDYNAAIRTYYSSNNLIKYQLMGILIRDIKPSEEDLSYSYQRLKEEIHESVGLKLIAIYVPLRKEEWLGIINGGKHHEFRK